MSLRRISGLVCVSLVMAFVASATNAAIAVVYDKNGVQVGSTPIDVTCWTYRISVQANGKFRVVIYPDCRFSNQFVLTDVDPLADTITGVRMTLSGGATLSVDAMGTLNEVYEDNPLNVDPETDLCSQAVTSCETWDGNPLQSGWSLSDPQSIGIQSGGELSIAGVGPAATLTVGLPPNSRQVHVHGVAVAVSSADDMSIEIVCNEGVGPDFVGATLVVAESATDAREDRGAPPAALALHANMPNPFNPTTRFRIDIPTAGWVRVIATDVRGRIVESILDETMPAGRHTVDWRATGLPSGLYVVKLTWNGKTVTRRVTLLR